MTSIFDYIKRASCAAILCFSVLGCATSSELYEYGNYSQRYYQMRKFQTDESLANYQDELTSIMDRSAKAGKQVPPGVYAEYAYLQAKKGNMDEAKEYYQRELAAYPESRHYIDFLMGQLSDAHGDNAG